MSTFAAVLPHVVQSAGDVRRMLRDDLTGHDVPVPVVEDAEVVVSELVANSLRHAVPLGEGGVRVSWQLTEDVLIVKVTDGGGPARPEEARAAAGATGGRGLAIVRELSSSWGYSEDDQAVTVHAILPLHV